MERVVDPEDGVAPRAACPATGSPARPAPHSGSDATCGCYDGSITVSFAGFAPADDPRFTIYVVVHYPENGGGGGSVGRPGVLEAHGLRAAALRRPADRDRSPRSCPSSGERRT